jgi:hypothetical protein
MDFAAELSAAEQQMKADPESRQFQAVTRFTGPTWMRLMETCIERNDRPVSHVIDDVVTAHYRLIDAAGHPPVIRTALRKLAEVWGLSVEDTISKLVALHVITTLQKAIQDRSETAAEEAAMLKELEAMDRKKPVGK